MYARCAMDVCVYVWVWIVYVHRTMFEFICNLLFSPQNRIFPRKNSSEMRKHEHLQYSEIESGFANKSLSKWCLMTCKREESQHHVMVCESKNIFFVEMRVCIWYGYARYSTPHTHTLAVRHSTFPYDFAHICRRYDSFFCFYWCCCCRCCSLFA